MKELPTHYRINSQHFCHSSHWSTNYYLPLKTGDKNEFTIGLGLVKKRSGYASRNNHTSPLFPFDTPVVASGSRRGPFEGKPSFSSRPAATSDHIAAADGLKESSDACLVSSLFINSVLFCCFSQIRDQCKKV